MEDLFAFVALLFFLPLAVYPIVMIPVCAALLAWFAIQELTAFCFRKLGRKPPAWTILHHERGERN